MVITQGLAIAGLILNILILPGLGTIVAGETKKGVWQLVLFLIGIFLILFRTGNNLIGFFGLLIIGIAILLMIGVWIWALVTSINIIKKAK